MAAGDDSESRIVFRGSEFTILLRDISGRELIVRADLECTVRNLKVKIAESWDVPPVCQKLICGTRTLKDSELLESCCQDGGTLLSMMLIASVDEARKRLDHTSRHMRQEALKAFAKLAPRGNRGAIAAVTPLLSDDASEVRICALEALAQVAATGDDRAIAAAIVCLQDVRADVRCAALHALTQLAPVGHRDSMGALINCLADRERCVRVAVLAHLAQWAPKGNADAVRMASAHLKNERAEVRSAALHALARVAAVADEQALEAVSALIEDRESSVKHDVLMIFSRLLPDTQTRNAAIAVARLTHGRMEVRLGALNMLTKMALQGNSKVVIALNGVLRNQERGLRLQALKAILQVAPSGSPETLAAVGSCLQDEHAEVRQAALRVLAQMACRRQGPRAADVAGCEQEAMSMLGACLEHEDRVLCQNAREALVHLVPDGAERAVLVVAAGLEHGTEQRKNAAWAELGKLLARGNRAAFGMVAVLVAGSDAKQSKRALQLLSSGVPIRDEQLLAALLSQMRNPDVATRLMALSTTVRHTPRGHAGAIEAVCELLEDAQAEVRLEAAAALGKVAQPDDPHALAGVIRCLGHKLEEVRRAALKALTVVAGVGSQRAISAASTLCQDRDYRVRQEAMKTINQLSPDGHENLAIVGPSVQNAIFAGSSRLRLTRQASGSALSQAGQQLGQLESSAQSLEWNECKALSLEATAYRSKANFAAQCRQQELALSRKKSSRGFQDLIMS